MVTAAGKTMANRIPISIERGKTKDLDFVFVPDGVIRGFVTTSPGPMDKFPGKPEVIYRSADEEIKIQSITLTGNGIHRTLRPIRDEDVNFWDLLIRRADFCYNHLFGFFGLPAGDYNLFIKAEGFRPIEKKYAVLPECDSLR